MSKDLTKVKHTAFICNGGTCKRHCSEHIIRELRTWLKIKGLHETIHTAKTYCVGECVNAPVFFIAPDNIWYKELTENDITRLIDEHFIDDQPLQDKILFREGDTQIHPVRPTKLLVPGKFENHKDEFLGHVNVASFFPWDQNTYPLIKQLLELHREEIKIEIPGKNLPGPVQVTYEEGWAMVRHQKKEYHQLLLAAAKGDPNRAYKISKAKFFFNKDHYGVYLANEAEGRVLQATIPDKLLWQKLVDIYVKTYK